MSERSKWVSKWDWCKPKTRRSATKPLPKESQRWKKVDCRETFHAPYGNKVPMFCFERRKQTKKVIFATWKKCKWRLKKNRTRKMKIFLALQCNRRKPKKESGCEALGRWGLWKRRCQLQLTWWPAFAKAVICILKCAVAGFHSLAPNAAFCSFFVTFPNIQLLERAVALLAFMCSQPDATTLSGGCLPPPFFLPGFLYPPRTETASAWWWERWMALLSFFSLSYLNMAFLPGIKKDRRAGLFFIFLSFSFLSFPLRFSPRTVQNKETGRWQGTKRSRMGGIIFWAAFELNFKLDCVCMCQKSGSGAPLKMT